MRDDHGWVGGSIAADADFPVLVSQNSVVALDVHEIPPNQVLEALLFNRDGGGWVATAAQEGPVPTSGMLLGNLIVVWGVRYGIGPAVFVWDNGHWQHSPVPTVGQDLPLATPGLVVLESRVYGVVTDYEGYWLWSWAPGEATARRELRITTARRAEFVTLVNGKIGIIEATRTSTGELWLKRLTGGAAPEERPLGPSGGVVRAAVDGGVTAVASCGTSTDGAWHVQIDLLREETVERIHSPLDGCGELSAAASSGKFGVAFTEDLGSRMRLRYVEFDLASRAWLDEAP
jgi:hypothetical protein